MTHSERDSTLHPMDDSVFADRLATIRELGDTFSFDEAKEAILTLSRAVDPKDTIRIFRIAELCNDLGFVSEAERFALHILEHAKGTDPASLLTQKYVGYLLAHIAAEVCDQERSEAISTQIVSQHPTDQNALTFLIQRMSYNPKQTAQRQKALAEYWARTVAVPHAPRPLATDCTERKLRIGYVSGDIGNHPVGLFIRGILIAHDTSRFAVTIYETKENNESLIGLVARKLCTVQNVSALTDQAFEERIREDAIDVLVDLNGFTAETRLAVFAREPAPVLLSWLGYWATTGLSCMDGVILDPWHAQEGCEADFTEPILRLPSIRYCYQPLSEDPPVETTPPCVKNQYVTFGSFNTTSKLHAGVFDTWAAILRAVPGSHMLLKWKTLNDDKLRERIVKAFARRGISSDRIHCLGWSSMENMLKEYRLMDVALDTFPFTGGMTSCNTLWMGVPLVTLCGDTVIQRQGYAILHQLDLDELVAHSTEEYIHIAVSLAQNSKLLCALRENLRDMMKSSPLLDYPTCTRNLENLYLDQYQKCLIRQRSAE